MINISSIKMYMYCPMKLYLKTHVDISQNDEYQLYNEIKSQNRYSGFIAEKYAQTK